MNKRANIVCQYYESWSWGSSSTKFASRIQRTFLVTVFAWDGDLQELPKHLKEYGEPKLNKKQGKVYFRKVLREARVGYRKDSRGVLEFVRSWSLNHALNLQEGKGDWRHHA